MARRWRGLFLLLFALGSCAALFGRSLWTPDEPRVAEIGRAMFESGDYLVPRLADEPFLEKPPLYWWVMTASYRAFGVSVASARLPSVSFALLTLVLVYDMARRIAGRRAGLLAACVLLSTVNFENMFRVVTDPALAFFVTLGYWAFLHAAFPDADPTKPRRTQTWLLWVHVAGGLAFLSKGIVGVGLLYGPTFVYIVAARRWSLLFARVNLLGLIVLTLACAAWPFLLYQRGGNELLDGFLVDNVLNRFLSHGPSVGQGGHKHAPYYYLLNAPPELLPWLFALPGVYWLVLRERRRTDVQDRGLTFMAGALPVALLLLSIPGTKRTLYMLPVLSALAVPVGVWLAREDRSDEAWSTIPRRVLLWFTILAAGLITIVGLIFLAANFGVHVASTVDDIARGSPAAPWLAGSLALVGACVSVFLLKRARLHVATGGAIAASWCVLWLSVQSCAFPLLEPAKDLQPFVRELAATGAFDAPLVGFEFDETTPSILAFYGGHDVKGFRTPERLSEWFVEHPQSWLLMLDGSRDRLPRDLEERLIVIRRWKLTDHREYVLARCELPAAKGR